MLLQTSSTPITFEEIDLKNIARYIFLSMPFSGLKCCLIEFVDSVNAPFKLIDPTSTIALIAALKIVVPVCSQITLGGSTLIDVVPSVKTGVAKTYTINVDGENYSFNLLPTPTSVAFSAPSPKTILFNQTLCDTTIVSTLLTNSISLVSGETTVAIISVRFLPSASQLIFSVTRPQINC